MWENEDQPESSGVKDRVTYFVIFICLYGIFRLLELNGWISL